MGDTGWGDDGEKRGDKWGLRSHVLSGEEDNTRFQSQVWKKKPDKKVEVTSLKKAS